MSNINFKNNRVYNGETLMVVNYSENVKLLEDNKMLECIIVDNTDFFSWYVLRPLVDLTEENKELFSKIVDEQN